MSGLILLPTVHRHSSLVIQPQARTVSHPEIAVNATHNKRRQHTTQHSRPNLSCFAQLILWPSVLLAAPLVCRGVLRSTLLTHRIVRLDAMLEWDMTSEEFIRASDNLRPLLALKCPILERDMEKRCALNIFLAWMKRRSALTLSMYGIARDYNLNADNVCAVLEYLMPRPRPWILLPMLHYCETDPLLPTDDGHVLSRRVALYRTMDEDTAYSEYIRLKARMATFSACAATLSRINETLRYRIETLDKIIQTIYNRLHLPYTSATPCRMYCIYSRLHDPA